MHTRVETRGSSPLVQRVLSADELDDIKDEVRREVQQLQLDRYQFKPETRCRVCQSDDDRQLVDKLLASGLTYTHLLRVIEPINSSRRRTQKITYNSLYNHAKVCFPTNKAAQAVYRAVLERRATEYGIDFVRGTSSAVTLYAYLETMVMKGYEQLTSEEPNVSVKEGMDAAIKLHELEQEEDSERKLRHIMSQFNTLLDIVQDNVTPEQREAILLSLQQSQGKETPIDAEYEEEIMEPFEPEVTETLDIGGSH